MTDITKLRDILDVHKQIMNVIPEENVEFRRALQNYIDSIWNQPPEACRGSYTYIPYTLILSKYIPNPHLLNDNDPIWKFQVRDIFNGE